MSKHRPDPDKIANELRGASSFFKRPEAPAPQEHTPSAEIAPVTPPAPPAPAQDVPAPVRPGRPLRRQMIRHPFELYMDQLDRLREVAQQQRQRGETGSMSKMVRDAIDRYLDEQPSTD
ncbi:MAG: hypothetical protein M3Q71_04740 [Chloroflexota bacterium]|nr:hypothetical protein [Chloroflexota bacterium]